jgi:hypothetical protein
MIFGVIMLFLRRRAFLRNPFSREKWMYITFSGFFLIVWMWNGVRPTPSLFYERAGLYWGLKTENIEWSIHTADDQPQSRIAYEGDISLAITFHKQIGWLIFHHNPNSLPYNRYKAVEFYILRNDLKNDQLIMSLYGDGKVKYPSEDGLLVSDRYFCNDNPAPDTWTCISIPLSDFDHPGTGIIGIAIGKTNGQDDGTFYIDNVRLIEK